MAEYNMSIHSNPDARAWADFFIETIGEVAARKAASPLPEAVKIEIGDLVRDNEYMVGWFANSMMAMHDFMQIQRQRAKDRFTRPEAMAEAFHEAYERLAPSFGYETRKDSAVAWKDVPEKNKRLMIAVCAEILG